MSLSLQAKSFFHSLIGKAESDQHSSTGHLADVLEGFFSFSLHPFPQPTAIGQTPDFSVYHYERKLYPLEKDIFDKLAVRLVTAHTQRMILSSSLEPASLVPTLERLVHELHLRYGEDDGGYRGFTTKDRECLLNGGYWSGRLWHRTSGKKALSINLYADDKGVLLTIFLPRA